ncbi:MAG: KpsF/GutQ family sugar-phosphate isomerase [Thermodesulfovibrionales bacterium]
MDRTEGSLLEIARRVLGIEADAVRALVDRLDHRFEKAVEIVSASRGRVVVSGMGKSGLVGKKIAATLASTGTPAFFLHAAEAGHGDLGMITSDDVVIAISNSGETEEIVCLIPFLKRFQVSLITMTGNPASTLAKSADVNLDVSVTEEACSLGIVPTASTTAALAMGDALAVALLTKRGFRTEDFAFFHPGGSLGRKFFVKVGDLMHSGPRLPVVGHEASVMQAIVEISSKRLGTVVVLGDNQTILGVMTDGDVRRGIERWDKKFFEMRVMDVMTREPKTISADALAAEALAVMETHSITALVISDSKGKAVGIIHLHDILKRGIA